VTGADDRLIRALAQLGAEHEPPPGWERRVLAAIEPRPRPHRGWFAIPLAALAAALVLVVLWTPPRPDALSLAIERSASAARTRGDVVGGDRIRAVVRGGADHRAIWVYRDGRDLIAACPARLACERAGGALILELTLDRVGSYRVVALSSAAALPAPSGAYDADLAATMAPGVVSEIHDVELQ